MDLHQYEKEIIEYYYGFVNEIYNSMNVLYLFLE